MNSEDRSQNLVMAPNARKPWCRGATTTPSNYVPACAVRAGLAAVLMLLNACAKGKVSEPVDPLLALAAASIKAGIQEPQRAVCELKFEVPMAIRNVGNPGFRELSSFCLSDDAPASARNCWSALKEQKVAVSMNERLPECLWPMNGHILETNLKAAGVAFPCGAFSDVNVTRLDKSEKDRLRVSYTLKVEKDVTRIAPIERQCGDITWPEPQEKSVSLFKEGERWSLPGR